MLSLPHQTVKLWCPA